MQDTNFDRPFNFDDDGDDSDNKSIMQEVEVETTAVMTSDAVSNFPLDQKGAFHTKS